MKPNFALTLSPDGIGLLHRAKDGWHSVGAVSLTDQDWPEKLGFLRKTAQALEEKGVSCKLVIPNSQILYTTATAAGVTDAQRQAQISAALTGLTPYAVTDLVFDWIPEPAADLRADLGADLRPGRVQIAAVARETLREAEDFARAHRFNPVSFVGAPDPAQFAGEAFFGATTLAAGLLQQGDSVERDSEVLTPVPSPPAGPPPAIAPQNATAKTPPRPEPATKDTATEAAKPAAKAKPATKTARKNARESGPEPASKPAPKTAAKTAAKPKEKIVAPANPDPDLVKTANAPRGETAGARSSGAPKPAASKSTAPKSTAAAAGKQPTAATATFASRRPAGSHSQPAAPAEKAPVEKAPVEKALTEKAGAAPNPAPAGRDDGPPLDMTAPTLPPLGQKPTRAPTTKPATKPAATSPTPTAKTAAQISKMAPAPATVLLKPSAASPFAIGPEPRKRRPYLGIPYLGIFLLVLLLLLAAGAGLWVTVFSAGFNPGGPAGDTTTSPPAEARNQTQQATAPASRQNPASAPTPPAPASRPPGALTTQAPPQPVTPRLPASAAPSTSAPSTSTSAASAPAREATSAIPPAPPVTPAADSRPARQSVPPPDPELQAELQGEPEPAAPRPLTLQAAKAAYAASGIWQRAPSPPRPPAAGPQNTAYIASIDPALPTLDAVALPAAPPNADDLRLPRQSLPAKPDTRFTLDQRGLVVATPDGALTPNGAIVIAGAPPRKPPARGNRVQKTTVSKPDSRLAGRRPSPRPADLAQTGERARLGGRTRAELARLRPRPRPVSPQTQPGVATAATALAVATSLKPKQRPRDFAKTVAIMRAAAPLRASPLRTAAVAPRPPAAPNIPTRASVAKQATVANAINLRRVNLIGVYGSPSTRRALVRLRNGRYVKVKVGDRIDGGKVAAIGENSLNYIKGGRNISLKMPKI